MGEVFEKLCSMCVTRKFQTKKNKAVKRKEKFSQLQESPSAERRGRRSHGHGPGYGHSRGDGHGQGYGHQNGGYDDGGDYGQNYG